MSPAVGPSSDALIGSGYEGPTTPPGVGLEAKHTAKCRLILSPPIPFRLYTLPYWSNPPFLIFDIRALRTERQSARMPKIKNGGLDQYGTGRFEQQQFGTAGVEWVNLPS